MVRQGAVVLAGTHCLLAYAAIIDKRIIGGEDGKAGDIPYLISTLERGGINDCGVSLLDSTTVLTAAHCTGSYLSAIRAGSADRTKGGVTSEIIWQIDHPDYQISPEDSNITNLNDIAILKLKTPIKESETIKYAKLPANGSDPAPDSTMLFEGWGTTSGRMIDDTPEMLKKVTMNIVARDDCSFLVKDVGTRDTVVCAIADWGKGVCKHDSGGPLVDQKTGQIVGLSSFVGWPINEQPDPEEENPVVCGKAPAVFTRVASYLDFIQQYVEPFQPNGEAERK